MKPLNLSQMAEVWDLIGSCVPEPDGLVIDYVYQLLDNVSTQNKYEQLKKALVIMTQVSEDTVESLSGIELARVLLECLQINQFIGYWQFTRRLHDTGK